MEISPQEKGIIEHAQDIANKYGKTFTDLARAERFEEWYKTNEDMFSSIGGKTLEEVTKWWLNEISSSNKALIEGILEQEKVIAVDTNFGPEVHKVIMVKDIIKYAQDKGITIN